MRVIKKISKKEFKEFLYNIDIKDKNLYDEANNPNMIGAFQITAGTARAILEQIKPKNFEELNAVNAFARPGTMDFVPQYLENKETNKSPYPDKVSELLTETNYVILYQEQVMKVFNVIGGFSLEETNEIRGLMKKLAKLEKKKEDLEKWNEVVDKFKKGAQENGISLKDATKIADDLLKMSNYSFNKSHSSAYTYIAIMTLYLAFYFRKYFYSSLLHYEVSREKYLFDRLRSVKLQGFKISPPHINKSKIHIAPVKDEDEIIFGLQDIKQVGYEAAKTIVENQPYTDFMDFFFKVTGKKVTVRAVRALASIGAFDELYPDRKRFVATINKFWEDKKSIKVEEKLKAIWKKSEAAINNIPGYDTTYSDLRLFEKEYLGFNFFVTPFTDKFMEKIYELENKSLAYSCFDKVQKSSAKVPALINSMRIFNDKNGNEMAFIEFEDYMGDRRSVPIFQNYWALLKNVFIEGKIHMVNFYLSKDRNDNDQIMLGKNGWLTDNEILRFVKRLDNL